MSHYKNDPMQVLEQTSRTFFIPISFLPPRLKETVTAAYLCMRAIDEVEDHAKLNSSVKHHILSQISQKLPPSIQEEGARDHFQDVFEPYRADLPEVTCRLQEWIDLCPRPIRSNVVRATQLMADGMAEWVVNRWSIHTRQDLDRYTYHVSGLVGLMLSDIWEWYDGTGTNRELSISFGRGLQAVNIIRNREEDLERGVDFFPDGWEFSDMLLYAKENLAGADRYITDIENASILRFCKIPLALAYGTLQAIEAGENKLSRHAVREIVEGVTMA